MMRKANNARFPRLTNAGFAALRLTSSAFPAAYGKPNAAVVALLVAGLISAAPAGLGGQQASASDSLAAQTERGISLASRGNCTAALEILQKTLPRLTNKRLLHDAALGSAQCGMSLDREDIVVEDLVLLNRDFPNDSKVLYITTRYYSEIANRVAHKLIKVNPESAEAQELVAEALQEQGKLDEAAAAYRKILDKYPNQPGIHYELGRIVLSKPLNPAVAEEARKDFEAELKINPASPATEFMLGELAWRSKNFDEAIGHFSQAVRFDAEFAEAYLGLGMALTAAGKYSQAVSPLEKYVMMDAADPAGHYQLAIAYARTGEKQKSDLQLALLRKTTENRRNQGPATEQDMLQPH